jgi:hypothetical protein
LNLREKEATILSWQGRERALRRTKVHLNSISLIVETACNQSKDALWFQRQRIRWSIKEQLRKASPRFK